MGGIKNLTPKIKNLLGKAKQNKVLVIHAVLVFALVYLFIWQVLNFYSFSTEQNISKAIKTRHMLVIDLKTGKALAYFPKASSAEANDTHVADAPKALPAATAEVAIILTGMGTDETYTTEALSLPPQYIFAFSPYAEKSTVASLKKAGEGALVAAQLGVDAGGKFDISITGTPFANSNKVRAALSKVYDPNALVLHSSEEFVNSAEIIQVSDILSEKQIPLVTMFTSQQQRKNIIAADVYIPANTPHDEVIAKLVQLEQLSLEQGYALAVIDPVPEIKKLLDVWSQELAAKKIKFTNIIKN